MNDTDGYYLKQVFYALLLFIAKPLPKKAWYFATKLARKRRITDSPTRMFDVFEQYIRQHISLTDSELEMIRAASVVRKLRKWQSILHEGEVWQLNCFIASGCCRLYRFSEDGVDHTLRFGVDNWWISDQESYNANKPSVYNIEALAGTTVIIWTKEAWVELMHAIPALNTFNENILARFAEASQRRIFSLISYTAEQKYLEFQKTYPSVFNRVPLHMVASYLGISRETLSRLRR